MPPIADLHDSLQDLSELINRRLVITDEWLRVVAYSIHESELDRARLSIVLAHSDSWHVPPAGAGPQLQEVAGIGPVLFTPLRDHRHRVGFLLLALDPDEGVLPSATVATLAEHAGELGLLLSLRTLYAERDRHRVRALLDSLLGSDSAARDSAAAALVEEEMLGAARQYSAVALGPDPRDPAHDPAQADAIARLAVEATIDFVGRTSTASVAGAGIGGGLGILVFPRPVVAERLARILEEEYAGVRAGLGPLVGDLTEVGGSFRRARDAWRVGVATGAEARVLAWSDLGLDRLLVRLPLDELTLDDLPPPVRTLLSAGLGTEVLGTLEEYLAHGGDAAATARALHVHRSTLYYRLDRVRAVTGVDLADGRIRRELHTGLRIAELAGIIPC
ncbi:PucR family transcriptional regulator [Granulicoccus sp. GXG6511]|uniref:PucR family transcriptional regulator n=1 Tax=Granulicoccus sp. GXG6511 TaxID=3381351 RepID=UPI003D7DF16B